MVIYMFKLSIVYLKNNGDVEYLPCVLPAENRDELMRVSEKFFDGTGIRGSFCGIQIDERL